MSARDHEGGGLMARLRIGGKDFPLVMTVGVLDQMALKGYTVKDIPQFLHGKELTWEQSIDHCVEFLLMAMEAGQLAALIRDNTEPMEIPEGEILRNLLTPQQAYSLCDAAIVDSLYRTVEAEPGKN